MKKNVNKVFALPLALLLLATCKPDTDIFENAVLQQLPPAPTELFFENLSDTGVTILWDQVALVDTYRYVIYLDGIKINTTKLTSYNFENLEPDTSYEFGVSTLIDEELESEEITTLIITTPPPADTQAPEQPFGLIAKSILDNQVDLIWNKSIDNVAVIGYNMYIDSTQVASVADTTYLVDNLSAATAYDFQVAAFDAAGNESDYSVPLQITTSNAPDTQAPSIPQNITISTITANSAQINWQASTDNVAIAGYEIYLNNALIGTTQNLSFPLDNLEAQTTYQVRLLAFDVANNKSDQSTAISFSTLSVTDNEVPTTPQNIEISNISTSSVTLSWDAATDNEAIAGYRIYLGQIVIATVSGTTFNLTNLQAGSTFQFRITAIDASGNESEFSDFITVTTLAEADTEPPSIPLSLNITAITANSLQLNWQTSTDNIAVTGYKIYQDDVQIGASTQNNYTVNNLTEATTYTFRVSAIDAANNESVPSVAAQATTLNQADTETPTVPTNLLVTNITFNSAQLNWDAATDNVEVAYYEIFVNGNLLEQTEQTVFNMVNLTPENTYIISVRAVDTSTNASALSPAVSFTTLVQTDTQAPTTPNNLVANNITTSTVSLSWQAATDNIGIAGYTIYQNNIVVATTTAVNYEVSGLEPQTSYSFNIAAFDAQGNASTLSNTVTITTATEADTQTPSTPTNLSASNVSTNSVNLSWSAATDNVGVVQYTLYQNGNALVNIGFNSYALSGLNPSTTYSFTVTAKDAAGNESEPSAALSVTTLTPTDTQAPSAPTNLGATSVTDNAINLNWSPATDNVGVTAYNIYQNSIQIATTTVNAFAVNNLSASTSYDFTVTALDAAGNESVFSDTLNISTTAPPDTQAPTIPNNLIANNITTTGVSLSWDAATDNVGVTAYKVFQNNQQIATSTTNTYTVSGLNANTTYSFTVSAIDGAGNESATATALSVTTAALADTQAPTAPNNLVTSNITANGVNLSWNSAADNVGVTGYKVYQNGNVLASTSVNNYAVAGLTANTSYNFRVTAVDAAGNESGFSNVQSITTLSATDTQAPTIPTNLVASNVTSTSINLTWTAATDNVAVVGYNIYENNSLLTTTASTTFNLTNLNPATGYSLGVSALDAAGNESAISNPISVTTLDPPDTQAPTSPTNLTADTITETTVSLNWIAATDNIGVTAYKIYQNGLSIATTAINSYTVQGLNPNTAYSFSVTALDAATNESLQSNNISVTTLSQTSTTNILLYTKAAGYDHGTQTAVTNMLQDISSTVSITITTDDEGEEFNSLTNLMTYDIVFFANTSGDHLNATQRANVESYAAQGGNFISNHAASDAYGHSTGTEIEDKNGKGVWDWYAENVTGCSVRNNPSHTTQNYEGEVIVQNENASLTNNLTFPWTNKDEWYYWEGGYVNNNFNEVLRIQSTGSQTYDQARMSAQYIIRADGGISFYTSMGHATSKYQEAAFVQLITNAINYIANSN